VRSLSSCIEKREKNGWGGGGGEHPRGGIVPLKSPAEFDLISSYLSFHLFSLSKFGILSKRIRYLG
jgi:hypothetical protein